MATLQVIQTDSAIEAHYCQSFSKFIGNIKLTKRELEVLKYVVLGYTAKKIGKVLNISYRTVESYMNIIKTKLNCDTKGEMVGMVIKSGLIFKLGIF